MEICVYVVKMENLEVILHWIKESLFYKTNHKIALNGELFVDIKLTKKRFKMHICQEHVICTKLGIAYLNRLFWACLQDFP